MWAQERKTNPGFFMKILTTAMLALLLLQLPAVASQDVVVAEVALQESIDSLSEEQALEIALVQAINELSGESYVHGQSRLQPFMEKLQTYLLEFETNADDELGDMLTARFDAVTISQDLGMFELVDDVVEQASVLLLLAIEPRKGEPLRMLTRRDKGMIVDVIRKTSRSRGLDIVLPLVDARDRTLLSPEVLLIGDHEKLDGVAKRYQTDSYVFGLFVLDKGVWTASLESSAKQEFTAVGESKKPSLALTQALLSALESEPVNNSSHAVVQRVTVDQMQSWSDFSVARDYLNNVPGTAVLTVMKNKGASVVFEAQLSTSAAGWLAVIEQDGVLQQIGNSDDSQGSYRFILVTSDPVSSTMDAKVSQ